LQADTGVATCCGACIDFAEQTWQDALAVHSPSFQHAAARLATSVI
jgi:bacterioferritin-associated ferredoxin